MKLKNNKTPDCDTIPAECLKYGETQLHKNLHKLVIAIWKWKTLANEWNEGTIIPIHKKEDRMKCTNYRGRLVTSTLNRLYGRNIRDLVEQEYGDNLRTIVTHILQVTPSWTDRIKMYQISSSILSVRLL